MVRSIVIIILMLGLQTCATHPTISPIPLKTDQVYTGVTISAENVVPVFVYRKGLSEKSDFGIRIGLPLYGTGIDYSRLIFDRGRFFDVVNFSYSLNPNANLDVTYYSIRTLPAKPKNALYNGFRIMWIPHGILKGSSIRVGFLGGVSIAQKVSVEVGYFHDFDRSQPIEYLFSLKPKNPARYPATTEYGFPSEYSRLTGLSFQVALSTKIFEKKPAKSKPVKKTGK